MKILWIVFMLVSFMFITHAQDFRPLGSRRSQFLDRFARNLGLKPVEEYHLRRPVSQILSPDSSARFTMHAPSDGLSSPLSPTSPFEYSPENVLKRFTDQLAVLGKSNNEYYSLQEYILKQNIDAAKARYHQTSSKMCDVLKKYYKDNKFLKDHDDRYRSLEDIMTNFLPMLAERYETGISPDVFLKPEFTHARPKIVFNLYNKLKLDKQIATEALKECDQIFALLLCGEVAQNYRVFLLDCRLPYDLYFGPQEYQELERLEGEFNALVRSKNSSST